MRICKEETRNCMPLMDLKLLTKSLIKISIARLQRKDLKVLTNPKQKTLASTPNPEIKGDAGIPSHQDQ